MILDEERNCFCQFAFTFCFPIRFFGLGGVAKTAGMKRAPNNPTMAAASTIMGKGICRK